MIKVIGGSKHYQYRLIRLTKTILGENRANQFESVQVSEAGLEALLGPYFDGIIASTYIIFRDRSVFSLNEHAINLPVAVQAILPGLSKFIFPKGKVLY